VHLAVFDVGKELYGVGIDEVQEIFRVPSDTPCGELSINVALKTN